MQKQLFDLSSEYKKLQMKYDSEKQELQDKVVLEEKINDLQLAMEKLNNQKSDLES